MRRRSRRIAVARADAPQQCLWLQPCPAAGGARRVRAVARQQHPDVHLVRLALEPLEEPLRAIPDARPALVPALPAGAALDYPALLRGRQVAERNVERNAVLRGAFLEVALALDERLRLEGLDRAAAERLALVRDHQPVIDADHAAESAAGVACAERRVERERARVRRLVVDVARRAVQVGAVSPQIGVRPRFLGMDVDAAAADAQCALERVDDARALGALPAEAVGDDVEDLAVRALAFGVDARIALRFELRTHLVLGEVLRDLHRKGHGETTVGAARMLFQAGEDGRRRIAPHGARTVAAVQARRAREHQFQVVVQLGHRADRAARRAHRIRLVDRDRRWHAFDAVHGRPVHAIEELPRVRREGLDVTALPLGVQRVEHERALARARHAGHHHQFAGRDVEVEIAQVVLARSADADGAIRSGRHGGFEQAARAAKERQV